GVAGLGRKAGAGIWEQAEVTGLEYAGQRGRAVVTGGGSGPVTSAVPVTSVVPVTNVIPVTGVVLAGGASSGTLLRPLGIRLPLTAGKGYSFLRRLRTRPSRPIHFGDIKVAVTPLPRGLRVAGTMELSGNNEIL